MGNVLSIYSNPDTLDLGSSQLRALHEIVERQNSFQLFLESNLDRFKPIIKMTPKQYASYIVRMYCIEVNIEYTEDIYSAVAIILSNNRVFKRLILLLD